MKVKWTVKFVLWLNMAYGNPFNNNKIIGTLNIRLCDSLLTTYRPLRSCAGLEITATLSQQRTRLKNDQIWWDPGVALNLRSYYIVHSLVYLLDTWYVATTIDAVNNLCDSHDDRKTTNGNTVVGQKKKNRKQTGRTRRKAKTHCEMKEEIELSQLIKKHSRK